MNAALRTAGSKQSPIVLALPRGRILSDVLPLLEKAGISVDPAFHDERSRKLSFDTSIRGLSVVRVRGFDVATYVAFGAAHLGVAGSDVVAEFDYPEVYVPVDLQVASCRLSVAEPVEMARDDDPTRWSRVRVATKYPRTTARHFMQRGVHAECVVLSGALELAPQLGLCDRIVDLVATGATLRANRLAEVERIADVTARLVVNRTALKLQARVIGDLIGRFREAAGAD